MNRAAAATAVLPAPTSPCKRRHIGLFSARSPRISPVTRRWAAVKRNGSVASNGLLMLSGDQSVATRGLIVSSLSPAAWDASPELGASLKNFRQFNFEIIPLSCLVLPATAPFLHPQLDQKEFVKAQAAARSFQCRITFRVVYV